MLLDEKVIAIERALSHGRIPHAFGGAVALAYYGTPRGTQDIDVNVFVGVENAEPVFAVLADLAVDVGQGARSTRLRREGQVRVHWDHTPIDLFFSYDILHDACRDRIQTVPFGEDAAIPILSVEDLVIFKVLFDRPKDRTDVREVLFAQGPSLDADYVLRELKRIVEPDDQRLIGFQESLEEMRE